jgi:hypothetical protein
MHKNNLFARSTTAVLGLIFFATPFLTHADESDNGLGALHYHPGQSTFLGHFDFTPDVYYRSESPAGAPSSFGTHTHFPVAGGLSYGVTDLLEVGVSEGFLFHAMNQTEHPSGAVTSGSNGGFSDPTLTADYRYYGGLTGTFFADAFFNYSPSMGTDNTTGYPGGGNNLRGASTYQLGTTAFVVSGSNEFSYGLSGTLESGVDSTGGTQASISAKESYLTFEAHGDYRYHFSPNYFMDASGTFNFLRTVDSANPDATPVRSTDTHYPCYFVPRLAAGYLINPSWLVTLGASYTQVTATANQNPGSTTATDTKTLTLDAGIRFIL